MLSIRSLVILLLSLCVSSTAFGAVRLDVNVNGVEGEIKDNILSYLSIEQQKVNPDLATGRVRRLYNKANGEIRDALQPFGYYEPKIESTLEHEDDNWTATYTIDPGRPVIVSSIDIRISGEGADDNIFQNLVKNFPLREGDILVHAQYEKGRDAFLQQALERGYFDAKLLEHEVIVQPEKYSASIVIHIDSGQRYKFGKVTFKQNELNEKLLKRYVTFSEGDPYSTDQLLELQNALMDSEYFMRVDVRGNREAIKDHVVPVVVTVEPRLKHLYSFGIGYGTDTGPRGTLGWKNRRVNKNGHHVSAEFKTSEIKNSVTGRYEIPIRDPRTDNIAFTTSWVEDSPRTSKSETLIWGVSRTVSRYTNWLETIYLNYQSESFQIAGADAHTALLLPGISWSRIKADNRVLTSHGSRLLMDLKTGVGNHTNLLQGRINGKIIRSVSNNARIILRGDFAATDADDFTAVPASLRFFAGGDQSVRGYAYESLGPVNADGEVTGGKHLVVGSVEYDHKIAGNWSGAAFYDAGNAMNKYTDNLKHGAGIGIRWNTIIGPIRLDYAWALSKPGSPRRFHIWIGPDL